MRAYNQDITLYGKITEVDRKALLFKVQTRSGDVIPVKVSEASDTTSFEVLTNLDRLSRDRFVDPDPDGAGKPGSPTWNLTKYIKEGYYIVVQGLYQQNEDRQFFEARRLVLPHWETGRFMFEETHWWIAQISLMADQWLDDFFDSTRSYQIDDFAKFYRTNLNITGGPTNENVQECATLSRLIYGLSSTYLLTGSDRYLMAAKAGVAYQREAYRSLSHDGEFCVWAYGRRPGKEGSKLVIPSENADDRGTIPLYEQIYALAGLAQYYRITQEWEVLEDIRRTVNAFLARYHDDEQARKRGLPGLGGYFSHLDYATMRPDSVGLGQNQSRKNWNSIGDHIPAYLVNLVLALDPLPKGPSKGKLPQFREICRSILKETTTLIVDKFPDPESDFVNERFFADWKPDHNWGWQQNRAIVGHNLKIAWNMTRVAFYYQTQAAATTGKEKDEAHDLANKCLALAKEIGHKMAEVGLDKIRGGIYDAVERRPTNNMPTQFSWNATKDFWQQEQGILAYLILHGADPGNHQWLELARESQMFWNCFFLDRDRQGIFFRTQENGDPVVSGGYGQKAGHSVSGYHAFELAYLAQLYTRAYVAEAGETRDFCLYYKIGADCQQETINVLPDFFPPTHLKITRITINGVDRTEDLKPNSDDDFQIPLLDLKAGIASELAVTFAVRD